MFMLKIVFECFSIWWQFLNNYLEGFNQNHSVIMSIMKDVMKLLNLTYHCS